MRLVGRWMIGLAGAAIIFIGARFLLAPDSGARGYGIIVDRNDPYLLVKGVRDIASGLIVWTLLLMRADRPLAAATLAASLIPIGDMVIVLERGSAAIALGVHGATATFMIAAAALVLRSARA